MHRGCAQTGWPLYHLLPVASAGSGQGGSLHNTQYLHNALPAMGNNWGVKHNTGLFVASGYFQVCLAEKMPFGHCIGRVVGKHLCG